MTQEQIDTAWRSLPANIKEQFATDYANALQAHSFDPNNSRIDAHIKFLEECFGKHNLTETEEEKPRETNIDGKFHLGDKVVTTACCPLYGKGWIGTVVQCHESDVDVAFGLRVIPHVALCDLTSYTEEQEPPLKVTAAESLIQMAKNEMGIVNDDTPKSDTPDWLAYRMELAKEVAAALIAKGHNIAFVPESTSLLVNGIIERLKGEKKQ